MYFEGDGFDTRELYADDGFLQKSSGAFSPQLHTVGFDSSDPYRDTSDAMRGMSLNQFGWPIQMSKPSNDFYADDDDFVRGCSMAHAPGHDSLFTKLTNDVMVGGFSNDSTAQTWERGLKEDAQYRPLKCPSLASQAECPLRFQPDDVPPVPPNTEHFHFEATTTFITTNNVDKVANCILDFLESQVIASIQKTKKQKYSIKVDMFLEYIMCTAKIRIWRVMSKQNHYSIEFQWRGGDRFVFGDIYRQCIDYLAMHFPDIFGDLTTAPCTAKERSMPLPPPPMEGNERSDKELDAELFPLLELAGMIYCPNLQAEAASALAKLACDDLVVAKYLSKAEVLDKLLPLLSCDAVEIVYPTARMLSAVAMKAATSVVEHTFSTAAIRKISDPSSNQLVRLELAKAVSAAFNSSPPDVTTTQAQGLRSLLESTTQDLAGKPALALVHNILQDVLLQLNSYC
jgi:hypothetical protein